MITLYLCNCIKFENKAIFVMSFSQSVENLRCIYIYYIDRFSHILLKIAGLLSFAPLGLDGANANLGQVPLKAKSTYCSLLPWGHLKNFLDVWPPLSLD